MQKDFEVWTKRKIIIHNNTPEIWCCPREIWICSLGENIGAEADGKGLNFGRPVLIVRVVNQRMFWGIPLSSKYHTGSAYYKFNLGGVNNFANLSQMRPMSTKRLERKITVIPEKYFKEIRQKLIEFLKNETPPFRRGISEAEARISI